MNLTTNLHEDWDGWIGKRVCAKGTLFGTLRFFGETNFSSGLWCGIVLDNPLGKNDGMVNNVRYFQCEPNFGIFVPHFKVTKLEDSLPGKIISEASFNKTFDIQHVHDNNPKNENLNNELGICNEWINNAEENSKLKLSNSRLDSEESLGILNPDLIDELDTSWNAILDTTNLEISSNSQVKPDNDDCVFVQPIVSNFNVNIFSDSINPIYASTPRLTNKRKTIVNPNAILDDDSHENNSTLEVPFQPTTDLIFDTNKFKNNPSLTSTSKGPLDFSPLSDKNISILSVEDIDLCEELNKTKTKINSQITGMSQVENFNATFQLSRISEMNESVESSNIENLIHSMNKTQCLKSHCNFIGLLNTEPKNIQLNSTFDLKELNKSKITTLDEEHAIEDPNFSEINTTRNLESNVQNFVGEPAQNVDLNVTQNLESKLKDNVAEQPKNLIINLSQNIEFTSINQYDEKKDVQIINSSNTENIQITNIQMNSTFDLKCLNSDSYPVDLQLNKTIDLNSKTEKPPIKNNNIEKDCLLEDTFVVPSFTKEFDLEPVELQKNLKNSENKLHGTIKTFHEISIQNDDVQNCPSKIKTDNNQASENMKIKNMNSNCERLINIKNSMQRSRKSALPISASVENLPKSDHVFKKPFSPKIMYEAKNLISYSSKVRSKDVTAHAQVNNAETGALLNLKIKEKKNASDLLNSNVVFDNSKLVPHLSTNKAPNGLKAFNAQQCMKIIKPAKKEKFSNDSSLPVKNKENLNHKETKTIPKIFSKTLPASKIKCTGLLKSIVPPSIQRSDSCKDFRESSKLNKTKLGKPLVNVNDLNTKTLAVSNQVLKPTIAEPVEQKLRRNSLSIMSSKGKLPVGVIKPRHSIVPSSFQRNIEENLCKSNSKPNAILRKVQSEAKTISSVIDSSKDKKINTRGIPTRKSMIPGDLKFGLKPPLCRGRT